MIDFAKRKPAWSVGDVIDINFDVYENKCRFKEPVIGIELIGRIFFDKIASDFFIFFG
jgi:hypothetical protein